MLSDQPAMANIAVKNIKIARLFYEGVLGLALLREEPSGRIMYKTGNTAIFIYSSEFAGTNKADYIAWEVGENFTRIIAKLKANGVVFKDYADMFKVPIIDGIHIVGETGLAWIEDPDGNLMVISGKIV